MEHTSLHFNELGILKVDQLFRLKIGIYMYKTLYSYNDLELLNSVEVFSSIHSYETRNNHKFILPLLNKTKTKNSIKYGCSILNDLPEHIVSSGSLFSFKSKLSKHLLHKLDA